MIMNKKCKAEDENFEILKNNQIHALEAKLSKMKDSKKPASAASMISTLKMAKEDSARCLISGVISISNGPNEEQFTFLDKLYAKNPVYRHMFPEAQSLGTDEKAYLVRNDELSKMVEED